MKCFYYFCSLAYWTWG